MLSSSCIVTVEPYWKGPFCANPDAWRPLPSGLTQDKMIIIKKIINDFTIAFIKFSNINRYKLKQSPKLIIIALNSYVVDFSYFLFETNKDTKKSSISRISFFCKAVSIIINHFMYLCKFLLFTPIWTYMNMRNKLWIPSAVFI